MASATEQKTTIGQHINGVAFLVGAVLLAILTFGLLIMLPGALLVNGVSEWSRGDLDLFLSRNGWLIGLSVAAWIVAVLAAILMSRADRLHREFDKSLRVNLKAGAGPFDSATASASDIAGHLRGEATSRTSGFAFSRVIEEDYGAGFWAHTGSERFWVAVSAASDDVSRPEGRFVVSVGLDPALSALGRIGSHHDHERHRELFKAVKAAVKSLKPGR